MKIKQIFTYLLVLSCMSIMASCEKQESSNKEKQAKEVEKPVLSPEQSAAMTLKGDIVLNTKLTYKSDNYTLTEDNSGMPVIYSFKWITENEFTITMSGLSLAMVKDENEHDISIKSLTLRAKLSSQWDKGELQGESWLHFTAVSAQLSYSDRYNVIEKTIGGSLTSDIQLTGLYNAETKELSMDINSPLEALHLVVDKQAVNQELAANIETLRASWNEKREDYLFKEDQKDVTTGRKFLSAEDVDKVKAILGTEFSVDIRMIKLFTSVSGIGRPSNIISTKEPVVIKLNAEYTTDRRGASFISLSTIDEPFMQYSSIKLVFNKIFQKNIPLTYDATMAADMSGEHILRVNDILNPDGENSGALYANTDGNAFPVSEANKSSFSFKLNLNTKTLSGFSFQHKVEDRATDVGFTITAKDKTFE